MCVLMKVLLMMCVLILLLINVCVCNNIINEIKYYYY